MTPGNGQPMATAIRIDVAAVVSRAGGIMAYCWGIVRPDETGMNVGASFLLWRGDWLMRILTYLRRLVVGLWHLIPGKKQYGGWSLPSKYTALGLVIGIVSLAIAMRAWYLAEVALTDGRGTGTQITDIKAQANVLKTDIKTQGEKLSKIDDSLIHPKLIFHKDDSKTEETTGDDQKKGRYKTLYTFCSPPYAAIGNVMVKITFARPFLEAEVHVHGFSQFPDNCKASASDADKHGLVCLTKTLGPAGYLDITFFTDAPPTIVSLEVLPYGYEVGH